MRVLLVVILDVLLVPVTGRKQSQLLVLDLSLEFDKRGVKTSVVQHAPNSTEHFYFFISISDKARAVLAMHKLNGKTI